MAVPASPAISDKEARERELRVVNADRQPGLYIEADEVKAPEVIVVIRALRQIIKEGSGNHTAVEEARRIVSALPTTITLDDIIDYQEKDDRRLNRETNFGIPEAIQRAEQVANILLSENIKCQVIYPKVTGSMDPIVQKLARIIKNGRPGMPTVVLLEGPTGVGKSAKMRAGCKLAGVDTEKDVMYFSLPTLAPEDFVGIPYPQKDENGQETGFFKYLVLHGLGNAKVMLLDETNRAHPKVLNGCMQLMLEGRINDQNFPKLTTIFCAINPPEDGNYIGAEDMDEAIRERIDHFIRVEGDPDAEIIMQNLVSKLHPSTTDDHRRVYASRAEEVCALAVEWWHTDLDKGGKKKCNPRRLEKICRAFLDDEGIETAVDRTSGVSLSMLAKKLQRIAILDMYTLLYETNKVEEQMARPGGHSSDMQLRFVNLVNVMKRNGQYKDFCKVAHLYKYIQRDQIPAADRDKSLYHFIQKAIRQFADEPSVQAYLDMLKERKEGRAHQEDNLKAVRDKLFAGISDKEKLAI